MNTQNQKNKSFLKSALACSLVLVAGIIIGFLSNPARNIFCEKSFELINREVVCGNEQVIEKFGYASTQAELEKIFTQKKEEGILLDVALYFRDLENGPAFGINETAEFAPASLLKLPFSLAYMQIAEVEPKILSKQLSFRESAISVQQTIEPTDAIAPDTFYSIEDLLKHMISYSDNNAYALLQDYLTTTGREELIYDTYLELGILTPDDIYDEVVGVRRYAGIFRALYNVSYLSAESSEKVLTWLRGSNYKKGLAGGVPEEISVAQKFGERFEPDGVKQLHDCGIVYFPENPYLLCIMTRGYQFEELVEIIRDASAMVYAEVDSRRIEK